MNVKEELNKGLDYFLKNPKKMGLLYKFVYGEPISCYCGWLIKEKYNQLLANSERPVCKYKLKSGTLIDTTMSSLDIPKGMFNNFNLTDEVAEILYKNGYSSFFKEKYL
jgi:hypothetical protein